MTCCHFGCQRVIVAIIAARGDILVMGGPGFDRVIVMVILDPNIVEAVIFKLRFYIFFVIGCC